MSDTFQRAFLLDDIEILSRSDGYGDGRTVRAYAAVFDVDAEIRDVQGHYLESIDPSAFNRAIEHAKPQGGRAEWRTKVFYNHGMTLHGTPAAEFSVPIGAALEVKAERRGLLTVTRYNTSPLSEQILESIRNGEITAQSFTGRIIRSNPARPPRGGFRPSTSGTLARVRRLELGLTEYGPTPIPAYDEPMLLGIRAGYGNFAAEVADALINRLSTTRHDDGPVDIDTTDDESVLVPDDPPTEPVEHSSRDALLQRIAAARSQRPDLFPVAEDEETSPNEHEGTAGSR